MLAHEVVKEVGECMRIEGMSGLLVEWVVKEKLALKTKVRDGLRWLGSEHRISPDHCR